MTVQRCDQWPNRSRWRTTAQHAGPLQRLQGLVDSIAAALRLGGDRLIARKAAAGAAVVEPPQEGAQHV
jgi:hypothetical protein